MGRVPTDRWGWPLLTQPDILPCSLKTVSKDLRRDGYLIVPDKVFDYHYLIFDANGRRCGGILCSPDDKTPLVEYL